MSVLRNCLRKEVLFVAILLQFLYLLYLGQYYFCEFSNQPRKIRTFNASPKPFTILLWSKKSIGKFDCNSEFHLTSNRSLVDKVDAIFFHLLTMNLRTSLPPTTVATGRNADIPWIFVTFETAINHPFEKKFGSSSTSVWNEVFNWSYSIYTDSEFYHQPMQSLYRKLSTPDQRWVYGSKFSKDFLQQKNNSALWVVSNCFNIFTTSQRTFLKDALREFGIKVDIYGKCGTRRCVGNCFTTFGPSYKFYLAFENSLCKSYITEKIQNGLANGMIPVVFGVGNLSLHAPPNSYIDVMDFNTVEELVQRLKFLENNPQEYFKYFEWRQHFEAPPSSKDVRGGLILCDVFRRIRERTVEVREGRNKKLRRTYHNIRQWYTFYDNNRQYCPRCFTPNSTQIRRPKRIQDLILNNNNTCIAEKQRE